MADHQSMKQNDLPRPDSIETSTTIPALPSLGFSSDTHALGFDGHYDVSPPSSPSRPEYSASRSEPIAIEGNNARGLGIATPLPPLGHDPSAPDYAASAAAPDARSPSIKSSDAPSAMNSANPLMGSFPQDSAGTTPDLQPDRLSPSLNNGGIDSKVTVPDEYQRYLEDSAGGGSRPHNGTSIKSAYANDFRPTHECPTAKDFHMSRWSWVSVTIIILCLFSTVFSGIFLGLATKAPRYGRSISSQGSFKPSDAILLTTVMAKLIELSFVTAFVAFLGQVLSRRAFMREHGPGVTLSEMSMWRWVVQPGTLITHWETAKYAGLSVLGILSLLSALLATLYTPAATAVVQPMLKEGHWDGRVFEGQVMTDFANVTYVKQLCATPIQSDAEAGQSTCLQIEHAGQGYHNYQRYLNYWTTAVNSRNTTSNQRKRPRPFGLLHENTTVTGQWVNIIDTAATSREHGRVINNISLAMPHSGVFKAAHSQKNGIMQPEELDSEGTYTLRASVPSPVMNVLCANMNRDELKPIVYQEWNRRYNVNGTSWTRYRDNATTRNRTVVDDLFGWTKRDPLRQDYPPVFAKLPKPFNTIMNHTNYGWGRDAIYLLGQGGADDKTNNTGTYVLCKLHLTITPNCSTHYTATGSGGTMEAHCEDESDELAYIKSHPESTGGRPVSNWRDVGFDWANSLSLNTGIDDADASNARLLTQLILRPSNPDPKNLEVDLNSELPSVAEALAVMAGCTLLKSMHDAPFVDFWNYTEDSYSALPATQYFNASLQAQQYASGGPDDASRAWIAVLFLVFIMNVFVLIYFLCHNGLVTDFSEPPNLFALAVNSPPSHVLAGSCGGGPAGKQYTVNWFVNHEGDHLFMEPGTVAAGHGQPHLHDSHARGGPYDQEEKPKRGFMSAIARHVDKLRENGLHFGLNKHQTRLRPASVVSSPAIGNYLSPDLEGGTSRTRRKYEMLAKRKSVL
ncbi:uncharacterized protein EI97DRAFT_405417 [Westerdykella ornata]|uniref:Uncharacterized protein n=1 Tax=Westerdykella ornata TaxID=318751 RepID=A0A6A6J8A2_WESOR|nr:uncharacterized protein EI97DRAFT_405417 [Westerdykella ornata]KAF2272791.1 hypothetical protein EI97DRAFT_405417 [Westerdykella ornata]